MGTQQQHRQSVEVGPGIGQVSPVAYWLRNGQFRNEDEARGAFRLAYQQGLDGMSTAIRTWMGLTEPEYDAWMRNDALPPGGKFSENPHEKAR